MGNRFPADAARAEIIAAVRRDGYAIVERAIGDADVARLKEELAPFLSETDVGTEDFWGHHTKRFGALIGKSEIARQMLLAPAVLAVADAILLEHCARWNYSASAEGFQCSWSPGTSLAATNLSISHPSGEPR